MKRTISTAVAVLVALSAAAAAFAHAEVSPAVAKANKLQLFTLAVPTEKQNVTTTKIEFTPPVGFSIDSFQPAPGWKRDVQTSGSGTRAVVTKVMWSGGRTPTGEDSVFGFLALPASSGSYSFDVRQTYSDGSVVDWSGPESADAPAPSIEAVSSLGGGSSTLGIVALAVAIVALVVAGVGLLGGERSLA